MSKKYLVFIFTALLLTGFSAFAGDYCAYTAVDAAKAIAALNASLMDVVNTDISTVATDNTYKIKLGIASSPTEYDVVVKSTGDGQCMVSSVVVK